MQYSFSLRGFRSVSRLVMGTCLLLIIVLTLLFEASFGFSIAHAAGGNEPQFGLQPVLYDPSNPLTQSYFIFDGKSGHILKSRVRVINIGTARGSVSLFPVDATTGQTSGAVYLNSDDPRKDVGAWLKLDVQQLTLDPGQSQVVAFQVTIPDTVRPGQHLGGIVAENLTQQSNTTTKSAKKNTSTFQVNIKNLTIIAVQVNLPGTPVEQLADTGVQAGGTNGYQQLLVGLSNTGTVMLKPTGTLQIRDAQGHVVEHYLLKLDTFLPQTAINYPVAIKGQALGTGDYQATLDLTYGHGKVLKSTTRFSITPQQLTQVFSSSRTQAPPGFGVGFAGMPLWQLLLVAGGGLVLLWTGGNRIYRRLMVPRLKAKSNNTHSS
jgi:Protein of unknown function C-terminal (DUF3324)/Bacterial protein of unknown function (DUF916)